VTRLADRQNLKGQPRITQAALFGLCPRCSARSLWETPAGFAPQCTACALDFAAHEPRGRLQFLIVLPVTVALIAFALWLDEALRPPLLALFALMVLLVPLTMVAALRLVKAAFLVARYRADRAAQ
jgi:uncharacterized protein (DUF983 family)